MTQIRTTVNGVRVDVTTTDINMSLLDLIRNELKLSGTKQGCGSGDCGACTVMIADADADADDAPAFRVINACITPAGAAHDKKLVTVEGVANGDKLHPVQHALIEQHASQCGFCTPGFVMSLVAHSLQADAPKRGSREEVVTAISGNLCRCTGYGPIISAGMLSCGANAPEDLGHLAQRERQQPLLETEPDNDETGYRIVHSEAELGQLLHDHAANNDLSQLSQSSAPQIIAGATDVWVAVNQQLQQHTAIVDITQVQSLQAIRQENRSLSIGACVTHAKLLTFFSVPPFQSDAIEDLLHRFGSPQIRNAGTIGGNICGGSPIADWSPVLLALDALVTVKKVSSARIMPLTDFFLGYRQTNLQPAEYLASIQFDIPSSWSMLSFDKISKRYEDDISSVCAAIYIDRDETVIRAARIAFGGVAATPVRVPEVEALLQGKTLTDIDDDSIRQSLATALTPISDVRASADYRLQMAISLVLQRLQEERGAA